MSRWEFPLVRNPAGTSFAFGPYALDGEHGLRCHGEPVHLAPKELALLAVLVDNAGCVVSHQRLWESVWPRQDVSYESLTRCVYALRKVLDPATRHLIVTVPRRGYRFGGEVCASLPVGAIREREKLARTTSLAFATCMQGVIAQGRWARDSQRVASDLFHRAQRIDPRCAVALGAAAQCRVHQVLGGFLSPHDAARLGRQDATRALAIDPQLVVALAVLGWFEGVIDQRAGTALAMIESAIGLEPEHAFAHFAKGWVLRVAGNVAGAVASMSTALALDPFSPFIRGSLAYTLFCAGDAFTALDIAAEGEAEGCVGALIMKTICSAWLGRHAEAKAAGQLAVSTGDPNALAAKSYAAARVGDSRRAAALAARALSSTAGHASRTFLAAAYVAMGDERAAAMLCEARTDGCPYAAGPIADPRLADGAREGSVREQRRATRGNIVPLRDPRRHATG